MNKYVLLAKDSVEVYIREKKIIFPPEDLPEEFFKNRAGVFVTIEKKGKLRGCVGTFLPTKENIANEIISNAVVAATEDYRFEPIKEDELEALSYTVSVLSTPERVLIKNAADNQKTFSEKIDQAGLDPKEYGIIIKTVPISHPNGTDVIFNGHTPPKSGLLLPDLEGIDTAEQQISIACQKGGIDPNIEKIIIYKFTVEKYS